MWWRIQNKILLNHPYFKYNSNAVLTQKEAEELYKSGFPSFIEMIEGAKERFILPVNTWSRFDVVIKSRSKKLQRQDDFGFITKHKRFAIAFMIGIIVVSFFTLIPFGRALASDFYNMIMKLIDGRIEITSESKDYSKYEYYNLVAEQYNEGNSDYTEENAPISYSNVDQFVLKTGYLPVTINTDWLKCKMIQSYKNDIRGLTLTIQYITSEGALIVVTQRWGDEDIVFEVNNANYNKDIILGNTELFYAIDPADGSFNGTAVLSDSLLFIGAEKDIDVEKLLRTLE